MLFGTGRAAAGGIRDECRSQSPAAGVEARAQMTGYSVAKVPFRGEPFGCPHQEEAVPQSATGTSGGSGGTSSRRDAARLPDDEPLHPGFRKASIRGFNQSSPGLKHPEFGVR